MSISIPENKRIGTLTERQRAIVASTLSGERSLAYA
jgi:hypothetical protein